MKLAWIIYKTEEDWVDKTPVIVFMEPGLWQGYKIIPIVYSEITE